MSLAGDRPADKFPGHPAQKSWLAKIYILKKKNLINDLHIVFYFFIFAYVHSLFFHTDPIIKYIILNQRVGVNLRFFLKFWWYLSEK